MMVEKEKYENFILSQSRTHFMQSLEWAKVKKDWENEIITVEDENGNIKGSMSILIRKVPVLNKTILYCPRGPIFDINDEKTFSELMEKVRKFAKEKNSFILRMDPCIPNSNTEFREMVQRNGVKLKKNINHDIKKVIQPKYEMILDIKDKTEDEVLKSFGSKTRYNIRLAMKKGVEIEEGTKDDIKDFYDILIQTSKRDEFTIRDLDYYKRVFECIKPENIRLIFAKYNGERVGTALNILYGNTEWYVYGASLRKYSNVMPNYLVQWEMIKWAINKKCEYYNFGGASGYYDENAHGYGVYRFKKGFNPELVEFVDELYVVFKPFTNTIFKMLNWIYANIFSKLRGRKNSEE